MSITMTYDKEISIAFVAATKLRAAKKLDYGSIEDYFPFKAQSYCHELHKKVKRLVTLTKAGVTPTHESIEDNLLDLINYASYYYEYLLEGGGSNAKNL